MPTNSRSSSLYLASALLLLALLACSPSIGLTGSTPTPVSMPATSSPTPEVDQPAPTGSPTDPGQTTGAQVPEGWLRFADESYGLHFNYPADWNGPEVNRWDAGVSVEIGTDTVYPFGTGREERQYTVSDAYFITVQYTENVQGWDWQQFIENQPWAEAYVELQDIQNGESISTARSLTTRLNEAETGDFKGLEYIATLSETAQTEIFYTREALLFDSNLNSLRVTGSPNNVQIIEGEDWRAAYQRVDNEFEGTFHQLLQSIRVGPVE